MKGFVKAVCWLLIIGHLLTESYIIVWKLYPDTATIMLQPFFKSPVKISVLWYIKDLADELLWVITYYVMAQIAYRYSKLLFSVISIFFFYHLVDSFMYVYSYKNLRWLYVVMLLIDIAAVLTILFYKPKEKNYKSLE